MIIKTYVEDCHWIARCDLPDVVTQGKDEMEALDRLYTILDVELKIKLAKSDNDRRELEQELFGY